MKVTPRELIIYQTEDEKQPFQKWLDSFKDLEVLGRINARLNRVAEGNLGDHKSVGEGVSELRLQFGKGYRIYFGQLGQTVVVVLLVGGDKGTQSRDIRQAQKYWQDYLRRSKDV